MTMQLVRVFALPGTRAGGNPAPVWLDADAMSTEDMQARTRERGREGLGAFGGSLAHLLALHRGQPLIVFIRRAQTVRQPEKLLLAHRG